MFPSRSPAQSPNRRSDLISVTRTKIPATNAPVAYTGLYSPDTGHILFQLISATLFSAHEQAPRDLHPSVILHDSHRLRRGGGGIFPTPTPTPTPTPVQTVSVTVSNTVTGAPFKLAMSTSFQPAEWDYQFFTNHPTAIGPLGNLNASHIRIQAVSQAIPQQTEVERLGLHHAGCDPSARARRWRSTAPSSRSPSRRLSCISRIRRSSTMAQPSACSAITLPTS